MGDDVNVPKLDTSFESVSLDLQLGSLALSANLH